MSVTYYPINEDAARRAKEANSFSDYAPGLATTHYRVMVDEVAAIAARQKDRVDSMYHDKIDALLDRYARRMAEVINKQNEIDARVPSVMIAGPANFPVRAKEKQNAARDRNQEEYNEVQGLLRRIKSVGMGGIMSDDENALAKLRAKLDALGYTDDEIRQLRTPDYSGRIGYPTWELSNNNANIHRIRDRITGLEKEAQRAAENADAAPVERDGYKLVENAELGRIQFIFDGKPDEATRSLLKANGFRWSPSQGAWQRMLNDNGRYAAQKVRDAL